jgi:hypothetical protein
MRKSPGNKCPGHVNAVATKEHVIGNNREGDVVSLSTDSANLIYKLLELARRRGLTRNCMSWDCTGIETTKPKHCLQVRLALVRQGLLKKAHEVPSPVRKNQWGRLEAHLKQLVEERRRDRQLRRFIGIARLVDHRGVPKLLESGSVVRN